MRRTSIVKQIKKALSQTGFSLEARLFGSEARGEARRDSDIDLLILVDMPQVSLQDEMKITKPLYQIELLTGIPINSIVIPRKKWGEKVTPFYDNVMTEGIIL